MAKVKKPKSFTYEWYNFQDLLTYAGIDNYVTSKLMSTLMPQMTERVLYSYYKEGERIQSYAPSVFSEISTIKSQALEFTCNLEIAGIKYDIEGNRAMNEVMIADILDTEDKIFKALGFKVDLNSADALADLLYNIKGFECPIKTKHGGESTSGDALKALYKKYGHEWLNLIKRRNDVYAMHSNFIKTYLEDWVKSDGRVHPRYNLNGTSSHRLSSSDPNLLNIPRGYYGYDIRSLYTVERGYVFITFDFSSCEVKILAALSGDEKMIDACRKGLDFHSFTASMMYNIPYEEMNAAVQDEHHPNHKLYKGFRQGAKAVTFGLLYGSSVPGIAVNIGKTVEETQVIVDTYFNMFPKVKVFIDDCHAMARANQFIITPFAQRKMEFGAQEVFRGSASYNACLRNSQNVSIQSPASTLGLVVFAEMDRRMAKYGGRAICTVYDSIELEIPIEHAAEAINEGFYVMDEWPVENFDWLTFAIGSDGELGWNWGVLSKVKPGITQEECEAILREQDEARYLDCLQAVA